MTHFSAFSLLKNALTGNKHWPEQWPESQPKAEYDVIIVGAGGHGLAAAYYLAKEHGITNVAVIDKGWLGEETPGATPRSSGPTIFMTKAHGCTTTPSTCGRI